jgi:DNA-binding FrmR family transcriptional regulator
MPNTREVCCEKEIYLEPKVEKELQDRLSRIRGHMEAVKRMLSEHKDCDSLLIQMAAIRSAIDQVTLRLLEGHMETCVSESVQRGSGKEALFRLKTALSHVLKHS